MEQINIPIGTTIHIHGMPYKTTSNIIVLGKTENYERTLLSKSDPSLDRCGHEWPAKNQTKGGKNRWKGMTKKQRSEEMKRVRAKGVSDAN
jgi:hypothetical protein